MKILIAYDGTPPADAAIDDLTMAGLPEKGEALVFSVADVWLPPENLQDDEERNPYVEGIVEGHRQKAREAVAALHIPHARSCAGDYVSISGGVASLGLDTSKPRQLINDADHSLYQAKARGRNCIISAHARAA